MQCSRQPPSPLAVKSTLVHVRAMQCRVDMAIPVSSSGSGPPPLRQGRVRYSNGRPVSLAQRDRSGGSGSPPVLPQISNPRRFTTLQCLAHAYPPNLPLLLPQHAGTSWPCPFGVTPAVVHCSLSQIRRARTVQAETAAPGQPWATGGPRLLLADATIDWGFSVCELSSAALAALES